MRCYDVREGEGELRDLRLFNWRFVLFATFFFYFSFANFLLVLGVTQGAAAGILLSVLKVTLLYLPLLPLLPTTYRYLLLTTNKRLVVLYHL